VCIYVDVKRYIRRICESGRLPASLPDAIDGVVREVWPPDGTRSCTDSAHYFFKIIHAASGDSHPVVVASTRGIVVVLSPSVNTASVCRDRSSECRPGS
jgi:hypothetical protein